MEVSGCSSRVSIQDIEIFNPHCVLNIGSIDGDSVFWSLPMWRRRLWLNIPDFNVSPVAIRQSLLSLLNSSLDPGVFEPWPIIDVWFPQDRSLREQIEALSGQTYDNWNLRRANNVQMRSYSEQVLTGLALSHDGFLWVTNGEFENISAQFLDDVVSIFKECKPHGSILVADVETSRDILENISSHRESTIRHVLLHRDSFFVGRAAPHLLPVKGLIGMITKVLSNPSTRIISSLDGRTFDDSILMNREDAIDLTLSHGPVQWSKWVCDKQSNLVSTTN